MICIPVPSNGGRKHLLKITGVGNIHESLQGTTRDTRETTSLTNHRSTRKRSLRGKIRQLIPLAGEATGRRASSFLWICEHQPASDVGT